MSLTLENCVLVEGVVNDFEGQVVLKRYLLAISLVVGVNKERVIGIAV